MSKAIFERDEPTACLFCIHEAALRVHLAGLDVQCRQLDRIVAVSQHEHITVRVIPFMTEAYAGAGSAITCAIGPVPQLDTAGADSPVGFLLMLLMDGEAQLAKYRATLDGMDAVALSSRT